MSEKTIFADWRKNRASTKKDGNDRGVILYSYQGKMFAAAPGYKPCDFWTTVKNSFTLQDIKRYATPEECEARKKEEKEKFFVSKFNDDWKTVDVSKIKFDYEAGLNVKTTLLKPEEDWIAGNEPEKEGYYQVTGGLDMQNVRIEYFSNDNGWPYHFSIIAYAPIKLKEPYVPPEPELKCPFCQSKDCGIDKYKAFKCNTCRAILTKEIIFELHDKFLDKLNGDKK